MTEAGLPAEGDVLDGRYFLHRTLGRGGMGMVFLAEQINLGRKVAVKVLTGDAQERSRDCEARFRREALAASRLYHPNIVQVLDYGRDLQFGLYLAMEYLDGKDFGQLMSEPVLLSLERIADLLIQTLAALEAAHGSKLLHRDIKPANIMAVDVPGRPDFVKVLDFGIAGALEGGQLDNLELTREGAVCGTPTYMAPEQAMGLPLDGRVDVYAVAAILYEMLTGELPFLATNPTDYLVRKVNDDPPLPEHRVDGSRVPRGLSTLCARGMARNPAERFDDAPAFRQALESWLRDRDHAGADRVRRRARRERPLIPADLIETGEQHSAPGPSSYDDDRLDTWAELMKEGPAPVLQTEDEHRGDYPSFMQQLIGRDDVLANLAAGLQRAEADGWDACLLVGPRGSGRSRILREIADRAATAGWEVMSVRPSGTGLQAFTSPADLLPAARSAGPRLVVVDDLDLLPTDLSSAFLDQTSFQDRPTCLLAAVTLAVGMSFEARIVEMLPLTRGNRLAMAAGLVDDATALDGPESDFPAWLLHRVCIAVHRGDVRPRPGGGWTRSETSSVVKTGTEGLVLMRLEALDPVQRSLLQALACAPLGLSPDDLAGIPLGPETLEHALIGLQNERLIEQLGGYWVVASRTVSESVLGTLDPAAEVRLRAELAELAARAARRTGGVRRRRTLLHEALQRERAGQRTEAAACLESVAAAFSEVGQPDRAVPLLRLATGLVRREVSWTTDRIRITTQLAEALTASGAPQEAHAVLDRIEVRPRLDPCYPAMVALARGRASAALRQPAAIEQLTEASRLASQAKDATLQVLVALALAEDALARQQRQEASQYADSALGALDPGSPAAIRVSRMLQRAGHRKRSRALLAEAIDRAEQQGDEQRVALGLLSLASQSIERGDPKSAARHLDTVRSKTELEPILHAKAALHRGLLHTVLRDHDAARACYRDALGYACAAGWAEGIEQARQSSG